MMLMIDIGNSRIKYAVWQDNAWRNYCSREYSHEALLQQFDQFFGDIAVRAVYVACVVDDVKASLADWFQKNWRIQPIFASATSEACGVTNAYEKVSALGVDRWLAMLAAYEKFRLPVCVIDCGTAVTLDVVDADGMHRGGLIMPGLKMMRESLIKNTSKIGVSKGDLVDLANNTADAVESGSVRLLVSGLDKLVRQQQEKFADMLCVITGGDGGFVAGRMEIKAIYIETLVLDGLRLFATRDC